MKLSGEQFQEIISQLVSDQQNVQQDKRREPRVGVRAEGTLSLWTMAESTAPQTRITIRDLSRGGINILTPSPLPRGARFILRLQRFQQTTLLAHYEVRYFKPLTSSLYSIGAKLVNLSESAEAAA